jgi:hypothetical protein
MAEISIPQNLLAHPGQLDEQESRELTSYLQSVTTHSTTVSDTQPYIENAMHLFFEQRRRTRTWAVGCALAGAVLGGLMGFYVGKPERGR